MIRRLVCLALWAVLMDMAFCVGAGAEHLDWMRGYTNESGGECCHHADCLPVPLRLIAQEPDRTTVEIQGVLVTLHPKAVHLSQETQTYWCYRGELGRAGPPAVPTREGTRCVFLASAG